MLFVMERKLDTSKLDDLMQSNGFSISALARATGYSKEAVSNWCRGESQPRPASLLRLALALQVSGEELLSGTPHDLPRVSFREKARRKVDEKFRSDFARSARHLEHLIPHLPEKMCHSVFIRSPRIDYKHIQAEAMRFRQQLGVELGGYEIGFVRLLTYVQNTGAIMIPVPWGHKSHPVNGVHVNLPKSNTDWLYINIDTPVVDAKFWLLHEIAHMLTPSLVPDSSIAEQYADAFAQAVLCPEPVASNLHSRLLSLNSDALRIKHLKKLGVMLTVSPYTLYRASNEYAKANGKKEIRLEKAIYGAVTNVVKETPTLSELMFSSSPPEPDEYVSESSKLFNTSFFDALKSFVVATGKSSSILCRLLGLSTVDAMDIYGVLTHHGATETTA